MGGRGLKRHGLLLLYVFLLIFSFVMVGLQLNVEVNEQFDEECVSVIAAGNATRAKTHVIRNEKGKLGI